MFNLTKSFLRYGTRSLLPRSWTFPPIYRFSTDTDTDTSLQNSNALVTSRSFKQWDSKQQKQKIRSTYKLTSLSDFKAIVEKYKNFRTKLNVNEEIVFLNSLADIASKDNISVDLRRYPAIDALLNKVKMKLRNSEQEYPLIGTLLHSMSQLRLYKDSELWNISGDYVVDGRMNHSFEELIEILKGWSHLQNTLEKSHIHSFFATLEDVFIAHYSSLVIPLKDLIEVCNNYTKTGRVVPEFIEILAQSFLQHLINELVSPSRDSLQGLYPLIRLSYYFAHWGIINSSAFMYLQDIVESRIIKANSESSELSDFPPEVLALLVYSLGVAAMTRTVEVKESIREFIREYIITRDTKLELKHLDYLHNYLPQIGIDQDSELVFDTLRKNVFSVSPVSVSLEDVQNYIETRVDKELNGKYENFPTEVLRYFDKVCSENLWNVWPKSVYNFLCFLERSGLRKHFERLWKMFPEYIVQNIAAFDFEQMCYLYFIYAKNGALNETGKFKENLEVLKDYILLYYRSITRGRLDITSNFYKVLEVVDINQFYQKGEY